MLTCVKMAFTYIKAADAFLSTCMNTGQTASACASVPIQNARRSHNLSPTYKNCRKCLNQHLR